MAVKYRGITNAKKGTSTSLAITLPAGTASGDFAVLLCTASLATASWETPAGWSLVSESAHTNEMGGKHSWAIFTRELTGTTGENLPTIKSSVSTTLEYSVEVAEAGTYNVSAPIDTHSAGWQESTAASELEVTMSGGTASVAGDLLFFFLSQNEAPTALPSIGGNALTKDVEGTNTILYHKTEIGSGTVTITVTKKGKSAYNGFAVVIKAQTSEEEKLAGSAKLTFGTKATLASEGLKLLAGTAKSAYTAKLGGFKSEYKLLIGQEAEGTEAEKAVTFGSAIAYKCTASKTGTVEALGMHFDAPPTKVTYGIYSHNAVENKPETLLAEGVVNPTGNTAVATGLSQSVTEGTVYWLAYLNEGSYKFKPGATTTRRASGAVTKYSEAVYGAEETKGPIAIWAAGTEGGLEKTLAGKSVVKLASGSSFSGATGVFLRGVSPGVNYTVGVEELTIAKPASAKEGDQMLMQVFSEDGGVLTPSCAGWTLLEKVVQTGSSLHFTLAIFTKKYVAGEESYKVKFGGSSSGGAQLAAWGGVNATTPINAILGKASASSSTKIVGPSIATTVENGMVVMLGDCNAVETFTRPSGMEKVIEAEGVIADLIQATPGSTGNKEATLSGAAWNVGFVVALAPASSGVVEARLGGSASSKFTAHESLALQASLKGVSAVKFGGTSKVEHQEGLIRLEHVGFVFKAKAAQTPVAGLKGLSKLTFVANSNVASKAGLGAPTAVKFLAKAPTGATAADSGRSALAFSAKAGLAAQGKLLGTAHTVFADSTKLRGETPGLLSGSASIKFGNKVPVANTSIVSNVYYGPSAEETAEAERLTKKEKGTYRYLDVYPSTEPNSPIVIFIHGGAWETQDKTDEAKEAKQMRAKGITVFSIDYREATETKAAFPVQISDVEEAIAFAKAHAATYNGNPQDVYCYGGSSGGNLATLAAARLNSFGHVAVRGVVSLSGVYDLRTFVEEMETGAYKAPHTGGEANGLIEHTQWALQQTLNYTGGGASPPIVAGKESTNTPTARTFQETYSPIDLAAYDCRYLLVDASEDFIPSGQQTTFASHVEAQMAVEGSTTTISPLTWTGEGHGSALWPQVIGGKTIGERVIEFILEFPASLNASGPARVQTLFQVHTAVKSESTSTLAGKSALAFAAHGKLAATGQPVAKAAEKFAATGKLGGESKPSTKAAFRFSTSIAAAVQSNPSAHSSVAFASTAKLHSEGAAPSFPEVALVDSFRREETPLSNAGRWSLWGTWKSTGKLSSAEALVETGGELGAYWNVGQYTEGAVAVEVHHLGAKTGSFFALGITGDPKKEPFGEKGYYAQFSETSAGKFTIALFATTVGEEEKLGETTGITIAEGDLVGLNVASGKVRVWHKSGAGSWTEVLSVANTKYTKGYVAVAADEGSYSFRNLEAGPPAGEEKKLVGSASTRFVAKAALAEQRLLAGTTTVAFGDSAKIAGQTSLKASTAIKLGTKDGLASGAILSGHAGIRFTNAGRIGLEGLDVLAGKAGLALTTKAKLAASTTSQLAGKTGISFTSKAASGALATVGSQAHVRFGTSASVFGGSARVLSGIARVGFHAVATIAKPVGFVLNNLTGSPGWSRGASTGTVRTPTGRVSRTTQAEPGNPTTSIRTK